MDDFKFGVIIGGAATVLIIGILALVATELQQTTCIRVSQAKSCELQWVPQ